MVSIHGGPSAEIGSEEQGWQPIYIKDICRLLSGDFSNRYIYEEKRIRRKYCRVIS